MNILHRKEFILATILLLALGHSSARMKENQDAEENDLNLADLADELEKIPEIGPFLKDLLNNIGQSLMVVSQLLNSIIARTLGGSLPCEMGPKNITCSGVSKESGVFGIVEDLVDQLGLPEVLKKMLLDVIKRTVNPVADTLLRGLILPKKKMYILDQLGAHRS